MSDLLDGIQRDIRKRLDELRPLVSEYEQLRRAVGALEGVPAEQDEGPAKPRAASPPRRRRAPAGTNRERVLAAVRDHPGASAGQIAEASGVQRTVVYGVLRRLADDGVIAKRDSAETGTGYAVASSEGSDEPATDAPAADEEPAGDSVAPEADTPE